MLSKYDNRNVYIPAQSNPHINCRALALAKPLLLVELSRSVEKLPGNVAPNTLLQLYNSLLLCT